MLDGLESYQVAVQQGFQFEKPFNKISALFFVVVEYD